MSRTLLIICCILAHSVIFSISRTTADEPDISKLPLDTLVWIRCPDVRQSLRNSVQSETGQLFFGLPTTGILKDSLESGTSGKYFLETDPEDGPLEFVDRLAVLFDSGSQMIMWRDGTNNIFFLIEIGLSKEDDVVMAAFTELHQHSSIAGFVFENRNDSFKLPGKEVYLNWKKDKSSLLISNQLDALESFVTGKQIVGEKANNSLADNRKFVRIDSQCEIKNGKSDVEFYVDVAWFVDQWLKTGFPQGQGKVAAVDTGIAEIVALGGSLTFNGGSGTPEDWLLEVYCATTTPRRGILDSVSLKAIDWEPGVYVPPDAEIFSQMHFDIPKMVAAVRRWETEIQESGGNPNQLRVGLSQVAPILVLPVVYPRLQEGLTGEFCFFANVIEGNFNGLDAAIAVKKNPAANLRFVEILDPAGDSFQRVDLGRSDRSYYVASDRVYNQLVSRIDQLSMQFPDSFDKFTPQRVACLEEEDCFFRFESDITLKKYLGERESRESLFESPSFRRVSSYAKSKSLKSDMPMKAFVYFSSAELYQPLYIRLQDSLRANKIYFESLNESNAEDRTSAESYYRSNFLKTLDQWQKYSELKTGVGPGGMVVTDSGSGIQFHLFQLRKDF